MQHTSSSGNGVWAAGGSVVAAAIASACCWLPLLLVAFGASAAGVSAGFERFRVPMLVVTAVLLTAGFYLTYFRKPVCAQGEECAIPNRKLRRLNQGMLWFATVAVVTFAAFPYYGSFLVGGGEALSKEATDVTLVVEGMTCEACATHIESELRDVAGVRGASVDYGSALARIAVDSESTPSTDELISAVGRAGYKASLSNGH